MAQREILLHDNPILRVNASPVLFPLSRETKNLIYDMIDTMYENDGIGLAAPQIGISLSIVVTGYNFNRNTYTPYVMINPILKVIDHHAMEVEEACLSVPGKHAKVQRFRGVHVDSYDIEGNWRGFDVIGQMAAIPQHEIDHTMSILYFDHILGGYEMLVDDTPRKASQK